MEPDDLRALLRAHPAVAIPPFGTRRGVVCVRASDAARLLTEAGHELTDAEIETAMAALGGERLRLVDPETRAGVRPAGQAKGGRGRAKPPRAPRRTRKGPPLEDLDVYELPADVFGVG